MARKPLALTYNDSSDDEDEKGPNPMLRQLERRTDEWRVSPLEGVISLTLPGAIASAVTSVSRVVTKGIDAYQSVKAMKLYVENNRSKLDNKLQCKKEKYSDNQRQRQAYLAQLDKSYDNEAAIRNHQLRGMELSMGNETKKNQYQFHQLREKNTHEIGLKNKELEAGKLELDTLKVHFANEKDKRKHELDVLKMQIDFQKFALEHQGK